MALTVPDAHVQHIKQFLELSDTDVERVGSALAKAEPEFNIFDLAREVGKQTGLPKQVLEGILTVLVSLYMTIDRRGISADKVENFLDEDVFTALKAKKLWAEESEVEKHWPRLKKFLVRSVSLDRSIGTAAKAGPILTQHERIFTNARILTDIRPIFHSNVTEAPETAVIIHMLKITQRDQHGGTTDLYFALDSIDIRRMRTLVDRAIKKEETLGNLMKKADVVCLNPKPVF